MSFYRGAKSINREIEVLQITAEVLPFTVIREGYAAYTIDRRVRAPSRMRLSFHGLAYILIL